MMALILLLAMLSVSTARAATMRAVRKTSSSCKPPSFECVVVSNSTTVPPILLGAEVLIKVAGSGLNPDEITILELPAVGYTLGIDVAGVVIALGPHADTRLKVGDRVWATGIKGGMAEFAVRPAANCGIVPAEVDLAAAGTLPTVAMTSYGALQSAGAPWSSGPTVLITAGTGGTGYMAVQLAKALGASKVVTAATGPGIAFARSLGADVVVDYRDGSVYDAVTNHSVDVVISNHKSNSTAARAMAKLKSPGGIYVTLDGDTAASPLPPGVKQVDYDLFDPKEVLRFVEYLDAIAKLLVSGRVQAHVQQTYKFDEIRAALTIEAAGDVLSKLAVVPTRPG